MLQGLASIVERLVSQIKPSNQKASHIWTKRGNIYDYVINLSHCSFAFELTYFTSSALSKAKRKGAFREEPLVDYTLDVYIGKNKTIANPVANAVFYQGDFKSGFIFSLNSRDYLSYSSAINFRNALSQFFGIDIKLFSSLFTDTNLPQKYRNAVRELLT